MTALLAALIEGALLGCYWAGVELAVLRGVGL